MQRSTLPAAGWSPSGTSPPALSASRASRLSGRLVHGRWSSSRQAMHVDVHGRWARVVRALGRRWLRALQAAATHLRGPLSTGRGASGWRSAGPVMPPHAGQPRATTSWSGDGRLRSPAASGGPRGTALGTTVARRGPHVAGLSYAGCAAISRRPIRLVVVEGPGGAISGALVLSWGHVGAQRPPGGGGAPLSGSDKFSLRAVPCRGRRAHATPGGCSGGTSGTARGSTRRSRARTPDVQLETPERPPGGPCAAGGGARSGWGALSGALQAFHSPRCAGHIVHRGTDSRRVASPERPHDGWWRPDGALFSVRPTAASLGRSRVAWRVKGRAWPDRRGQRFTVHPIGSGDPLTR